MNALQQICGIDFGAWTLKVAALRDNRHYEILINEANFRETPSLVAYSDSQRLIGEAGTIKMKSNFRNSLRSPLRLLGIQQRLHLLEQELKFTTIQHKIINNQLKLFPKYSGQVVETDVQEFITGLMTKAKQICSINQVNPDAYFLSIPSYLNNGQRKAIKACAEAASFKNVNLVEEWEGIAAEYIFFRWNELNKQNNERLVIFIDVGYSKFGAYACLVSKNQAKLIDHELLRYSGSRNMDRLIIDFYESMFKKQFNESLENNLKSLVKLSENVENQRKKLSANSQNHLNIQCILGDNDLQYNMKREEMENIIMPVFAEFASSMQNLKSRVDPIAQIYSIQIIGGASRTPFFQEITKNIFHIDPSKTLNTSETVARGTSIAGAMRLGLLGLRTVNFKRTFRFPIYYNIHSLSTEQPFQKDISKYDNNCKKPLFAKDQQYPANHIIKIPISGLTEVIIYSEQNVGKKILGYFKFVGEQTMVCLMDMDGILRVRLGKQQKFEEYDVGDFITIEKSKKLQEREEKMKKRDMNFTMSYQLRNKFETEMYELKNNINGEWKNFASSEQIFNIVSMIKMNQQWISEMNDPQQLNQRMENLNSVNQLIQNRRKNYSKLLGLIQKFKDKYSLYSKVYKNKHEKLVALNDLNDKFQELEAQEMSVFWEGTFLNEQVIHGMLEEAEKIKK